MQTRSIALPILLSQEEREQQLNVAMDIEGSFVAWQGKRWLGIRQQ